VRQAPAARLLRPVRGKFLKRRTRRDRMQAKIMHATGDRALALATPGVVQAGGRTLGVVRLAITEMGRATVSEPVVAAAAPVAPDVATHSAPTHTGWIVQVGAFDVERDAQQRLSSAHAKVGHALDNADPFTEPVVKGDKTLYRARFAGFQQKDEADAVCKQLKRNDIDCMTIRN
jgi:sporulation related protein